MMKKFHLVSIVLLILFSSKPALSQITVPEKRPFNIGIFSGVGGVNFTPIPGIDLCYKRNIIRFAPGYKAAGGGYIREIIPFSKAFYNCYWIASVYAGVGKEEDLHARDVTSDFTRGIVLTGAKIYFSHRWYTQLQGGASYTRYTTPGFPDDKKFSPYFEFSLGINIFRTYLNEEKETEYEE